MKLMSDLIAYLRDLLVFKVKPEALAEEACVRNCKSSLGAEAALIETDRLLDLIDQFAAAEGRMKWAPNKKLHFEVAVIKAIQTLGQVTLTEVIDNLTVLRSGTPTPIPAPAPNPTRAPARDRARNRPPEPKSAPKAPEPAAPTDLSAVWSKTAQLFREQRPLFKGWVDAATFLGAKGREFTVGFPSDQKTALDSLARPSCRHALEALLKEVSGQDWTLKLQLDDNLPSVPQPSPEKQPTLPPNESAETFKNDPLIQEALEIFKGQIKSVTT